MFCNKCGEKVDQNAKFCNKCGEKLEGYIKTGSITFRRDGQYYGCLVPVKVFLDNNLVMSLGIGEEQTVQTTIGKHRIDFNVMGGNGGDEIELTEKSPNKKVIFKLGMGMITAKPKIISVLDI
jgi:hypothetical protein